jgi:hypothetical protein
LCIKDGKGDHQYCKILLRVSVSKSDKEIADIVKVIFRVSVSKSDKEIANIVKVILELVYQRAIRRSPI